MSSTQTNECVISCNEGKLPIFPEDYIAREITGTSSKPTFFTLMPNLSKVNRCYIDFLDLNESNFQPSLKSIQKLAGLIESIERGYVEIEPQTRYVADLSQIYTFRRFAEVKKFLAETDSIEPILYEASSKIREYFPSGKLLLEVFTDPEASKKRLLVISIQVNLTLPEATYKLDQLDRDWWLNVRAEKRRQLCIHLEFV